MTGEARTQREGRAVGQASALLGVSGPFSRFDVVLIRISDVTLVARVCLSDPRWLTHFLSRASQRDRV